VGFAEDRRALNPVGVEASALFAGRIQGFISRCCVTLVWFGRHFTKKTGDARMPIAVGQKAPDFTLKDQNQKDVKLSDFQGKNVVLAFYPLDWSPVCSNEHACFTNDLKDFENLNAQVLGISVDSVWSHKAFAEKLGIRYPLLADFHPRGAVASQFGLYLADKGITNRATVIVDKHGVVRYVQVYDIPTQRSNADLVAELKKWN
jgi:peroxiredoxin